MSFRLPSASALKKANLSKRPQGYFFSGHGHYADNLPALGLVRVWTNKRDCEEYVKSRNSNLLNYTLNEKGAFEYLKAKAHGDDKGATEFKVDINPCEGEEDFIGNARLVRK